MCAEVINLEERRAGRADPVLAQMEAYWDGLRTGRTAPSRSEINPTGLSGILRNSFILERIAPATARFRVAGQLLGKSLGAEAVGREFADLFLGDTRDQLEASLERVFIVPVTSELRLLRPETFRAPASEARMLLLPLADDLGRITRILGCLSVDSEPEDRPAKFDIVGVTERRIPKAEAMARRVPKILVRQEGPADIIRLPVGAD